MSLEYDTYFLPDNLAVSVNWGLFCGCPWNTRPTFLPDNLAVSVNWGLFCGCPWNTIPTFYLWGFFVGVLGIRYLLFT